MNKNDHNDSIIDNLLKWILTFLYGLLFKPYYTFITFMKHYFLFFSMEGTSYILRKQKCVVELLTV